MSARGDSFIFTASAIGLCCLLAWDAADERDRRIAAEERLQQIEQASRTYCPQRPGQRLVTTIDTDTDGDLQRWCGYYRTVIESVPISWEMAR